MDPKFLNPGNAFSINSIFTCAGSELPVSYQWERLHDHDV